MPFEFNGQIYSDIDDSNAGRFFSHATLGCNFDDLLALKNLAINPKGYFSWLEAQFNLPFSTDESTPVNDESTHFSWVMANYGGNLGLAAGQYNNVPEFKDIEFTALPFVSSVVRKAMHTKHLLRLKTAYALSQILVVSGASGLAEGMVGLKLAGYFDILESKAFSSYEDILWEVSKNIVMSEFLTFKGSKKGGIGSAPDENYARELMQLFTIGPVALDKNTGAPVVKSVVDGVPVFEDAYTSLDVAAVAKIFTGWVDRFAVAPNRDDILDPEAYRGVDGKLTSSRGVVIVHYGNRGLKNMADDHSTDAIGIKLPLFEGGVASGYHEVSVGAGGDAELRMRQFISLLVRHPNTAFHVSRILIQRFTTSNPSQAYVSRVAAAFRTPVNGRVGDMKAVLKAILLDESLFRVSRWGVRRDQGQYDKTFGKIREPFVRLTNWARAFGAKDKASAAIHMKYALSTEKDRIYAASNLGQAVLCAPSVFNFYRPGYVPPDSIFSAQTYSMPFAGTTVDVNLVAPEMQITNGSTMTAYANYIYQCIDSQKGVGGMYGLSQLNGRSYGVVSDYEDLIRLLPETGTNLDALLQRITTLLYCSVRSSWQTIKNHVEGMPRTTLEEQKKVIQAAIYLFMISTDYIVIV